MLSLLLLKSPVSNEIWSLNRAQESESLQIADFLGKGFKWCSSVPNMTQTRNTENKASGAALPAN